MKKKYILMQRDIEDQKEEMKLLQTKEKELHEQIKVCAGCMFADVDMCVSLNEI